MKKLIFVLAATMSLAAVAQSPETFGDRGSRYYGSASAEDAILFTTNDVLRWDRCMLMSPDGAVYVEGSIDGLNYSSALALQDLGSTSLDPVLVTTADQMFAVLGRYRFLRVRQDGMTPSSASMLCWSGASD